MIKKVTKSQLSDSEILQTANIHPRKDLLILLSQGPSNPYQLTREIGLTFKGCYSHLKNLEEVGLIGGRLKYHITDRGRYILLKLEEIGDNTKWD